MTNAPAFPTRVIVRARPAVAGSAVRLCFEMRRKNAFSCAVFLDATGVAEVSGKDLLNAFDDERAVFLMDYGDPRNEFTGRVTASVMSAADLDRALEAFDMYREAIAYRPGYEDRLRIAAALPQAPDDYAVEVDLA